MTRRDLETLLLTLESTPALLQQAAASFSPRQARVRPCKGGFSFVENVWHLADLEREGYGARISRILSDENPALENFDGEKVARERAYQDKDVARGIAAFTRARHANLAALRAAAGAQWDRSGSQEGVGRVTLADLPRMMAEHDRAHGDEIADLLALVRGTPRADRPNGGSAVA
ncbi:MAG TPA: DinB family protein [Thermoanaerobaculia bacterium]|nr:DinB family protein [Thermoanaerobaculia bacterium]